MGKVLSFFFSVEYKFQYEVRANLDSTYIFNENMYIFVYVSDYQDWLYLLYFWLISFEYFTTQRNKGSKQSAFFFSSWNFFFEILFPSQHSHYHTNEFSVHRHGAVFIFSDNFFRNVTSNNFRTIHTSITIFRFCAYDNYVTHGTFNIRLMTVHGIEKSLKWKISHANRMKFWFLHIENI